MPTYRYHVQSGAKVTGDAEGSQQTNNETALREAGNAAGEVLLEELAEGSSTVRVMVTVERSDGVMIGRVTTTAAVETYV